MKIKLSRLGDFSLEQFIMASRISSVVIGILFNSTTLVAKRGILLR